jgi:micrococcal nuclease
LTGGSGSPGSGTTPTPSPSSTSTSTPTQAPTTSPTTGGTDPRFQYCYQAIAAGYGPYYSGVDPEYDWYLDADSDGVVCET